VTYVESGRQALSLVAAHLHGEGRRRVVVPGYLCESMIQPFAALGWEIAPVPVDGDLRVRPDGLGAYGHGDVVLAAEYFGRDPREPWVEALRDVRARGGVVIDDETHRVFRPGRSGADVAVASLRKVLPVAAGAYVRGPVAGTVLGSPGPVGDLRRQAMRRKSEYVGGARSDKAHLELFAEAEALTEAALTPAALGDADLVLLRRLDVGALAAARRANADVLGKELADCPALTIVNPPDAESVTSHLVISVADPQALRRHLVGEGIYCPIHWPQPSGLPLGGPWPSVYLSLPVDHRYGIEDMRRVAAAVRSGLR
jgi:selenocysteine lyase/cysteine desulfurase